MDILIKDSAQITIVKAKGNGVYAFVLSGDITINNQELKPRDGFGIWDTDKLSVRADSDAEFLIDGSTDEVIKEESGLWN